MKWLACLAISLGLAAFNRANAAELTPGQLEALYQRIDNKQGMTRAEKYDAKMSVLKSSLAAGGAYTDAMESLQRYARIGAEPSKWKWLEDRPKSYAPEVKVEKDRVTVTFYTYSGLTKERIYRHVDTYRPGKYRPKVVEKVIAEGPAGFAF